MFFLKLTLYTCAFYSAIALPIVAGELALTYWFGGFGIHFHGRIGFAVFAAFWGTVWLASFLFAFRIVFGVNIWGRLLWLS